MEDIPDYFEVDITPLHIGESIRVRDLKSDKLEFIDPKGIRNSRGMNDPKIQFHKVIKEKIQPQVESQGIVLDSYIVSNTSYLEVNWRDNFEIKDFNAQNVYFQKENIDTYIESILN